MQRGGKRRPIPDDEEEDDVKKVSYTFETSTASKEILPRCYNVE